MREFVEDGTNGPHIDSSGVDLATEEDLGGTIPERDDLMRVGLERKTHGARQTKVRNFNLRSLRIDQQVARLEVAMHDPSLVAVQGSLQQLVHDVPHLVRLHRPAQLVQILLHVLIEVLEDQE